MKIQMLFFIGISCLAASVQGASVRAPGIDIDIGGPYGYYYYYDNPYYQGWAGPGWYYGIWFSGPDDYYDWLDNDFYTCYWTGPGYYYGVYFRDEPHFNDYRYYHRNYGRSYNYGDPSYHKKAKRGKWDSRDHRNSDRQKSARY